MFIVRLSKLRIEQKSLWNLFTKKCLRKKCVTSKFTTKPRTEWRCASEEFPEEEERTNCSSAAKPRRHLQGKFRFETFGENFQNRVSLRCNLLSCRADVESFLCLRQEIFLNDLDSVWQTDIESTKELFGENHRSWSTLLPQNHLLSFVKKFEVLLLILIANSWTNTDFPSLSETCFESFSDDLKHRGLRLGLQVKMFPKFL